MELDKYHAALVAHDWHHAYSDSGEVNRRGQAAESQLESHIGSPEHDEMFKVMKSAAHAGVALPTLEDSMIHVAARRYMEDAMDKTSKVVFSSLDTVDMARGAVTVALQQERARAKIGDPAMRAFVAAADELYSAVVEASKLGYLTARTRAAHKVFAKASNAWRDHPAKVEAALRESSK